MWYNGVIVVKNTTPSFGFLREISLSVLITTVTFKRKPVSAEFQIPLPPDLAEGGDIHRNPNSRVELVHATYIVKALPADIKSYHFFGSPHSFCNLGHVSLILIKKVEVFCDHGPESDLCCAWLVCLCPCRTCRRQLWIYR